MNLKRTDRLELPRQLRSDPELASRIRNRAEINCRSIQLEILFLIQQGLKVEDGVLGRRVSDAVRPGLISSEDSKKERDAA